MIAAAVPDRGRFARKGRAQVIFARAVTFARPFARPFTPAQPVSWAVAFTRPKPGTCRRHRRGKTKHVEAPPRPSARSCTAVGQRCANCRRRRLWLRRGLCWRCYSNVLTRGRHFEPDKTRLARNPDIRDALDLLAGLDIQASAAGPCPGPLPGVAGSDERLLALALRADAHLALFPRRADRLPLDQLARLFGITLEAG